MRSAEDRRAFCEARAAQMAADPTEAERQAWEILEPLGFERQVPVEIKSKNGGVYLYILDFAWPMLAAPILCVEVDGSSHRRKKGHDRRRDTRLACENIVTLRFTNRQVLNRPDEVRLKVAAAMDRLSQGLPLEPRKTKWDDVPNTEF